MKRFFIAIIFCSLFYACKPGIPKSVIQPEEMEKVLYDIHVVDGYAAAMSAATPDSLKKTITPYYLGVYQKYGIDSVRYNRSLNYYYKHPEVMKTIYDHVTERLLKVKDQVTRAEAQAAATPRKVNLKADSTKKEKLVQ